MVKFCDYFGEFWVCDYSQKSYKHFYDRCKNAKEFLLKMDDLPVIMTKSMKNANPPRFDFSWKDEKTLIYKSRRNLIYMLVGLAKGVGKFYKENIIVTKIANDKIQIVFP
jgi:hypothetical protein